MSFIVNYLPHRPQLGIVFFVLALMLLPVAAGGQPAPAAQEATQLPGALEKHPDIVQTLQQQIKEFTEQLLQARQDLERTQENSRSLAVALSSHKAALSLDKLSLEEARKLQQQHAELIEQKTQAVAALTPQLERVTRLQAEMRLAKNKLQEEIDQLAKTPLKTKPSKVLAQQDRQFVQLAATAVSRLDELQAAMLARLELLKQQQASLQEFSNSLQEYIEKKAKDQLLERRQLSDIIAMAREAVSTTLSLPQRTLDWTMAKIHSGAAARMVQAHRSQLLGLAFFLAALIYVMALLRRVTREFRQQLAARAATFSLRLLIALSNSLARNYYLLALTLWVGLSLWVMSILGQPAARMLLYGLLAYTVVRLSRHLLTALFAPDQGIIPLDAATARYYNRYGFLALFFLVVGFYVVWLLEALGYHAATVNFAVLVFLIVTIFWFALLLRKSHLENFLTGVGLPPGSWFACLLRGFRLLVLLGLSAIIILDLLGFQNLALYLAGSLFLTALVIAGGWLLEQLGKDLNNYLSRPPEGLLGLRWGMKTENLTTIHNFFARVLHVTVIGFTVVGVLLAWGVDLAVLRKILALLSTGPAIGPLTLSPLAIFLAILSFVVARKLSLVSQVVLEKRLYQRREWDLGVQTAISSTLHYVFLTIGVIVALGFLGINFTNLAIIAGGLSVGIGFGMQNIANNFVSGLILLFERPIKVGDLLIVDGNWGIVKAIRVRSTLFQTSDRCIIVIPNSELISNKIINWTFFGRGPNRLTLKVGVSYGSDVHEVTRTIDAVCRQNERVLLDPPPQVFFSAYGDSSLDFTIWVFVRTPDDRIPATHELNAAIFDAFNDKGIEIPFPQRDVHFRTLPPQITPEKA
ncbi:MAG: mechanosensitive ion channel [Deltaproteobacteria bacterium]|nr:mechanosensitive ion channel [Deltaproteobacteria bacterium]